MSRSLLPLSSSFYHSFLTWLNIFIVTFFPLTNFQFLSHNSLFDFPLTPFPLLTDYSLSSLNLKTDIPGFFLSFFAPNNQFYCYQTFRILSCRSINSGILPTPKVPFLREQIMNIWIESDMLIYEHLNIVSMG
jgi:hypothetical protein